MCELGLPPERLLDAGKALVGRLPDVLLQGRFRFGQSPLRGLEQSRPLLDRRGELSFAVAQTFGGLRRVVRPCPPFVFERRGYVADLLLEHRARRRQLGRPRLHLRLMICPLRGRFRHVGGMPLGGVVEHRLEAAHVVFERPAGSRVAPLPLLELGLAPGRLALGRLTFVRRLLLRLPEGGY